MYARKTKVPIANTRTEIERRLVAAGATAFGYATEQGLREVVTFRIADRFVRVEVGIPKTDSEHRRRWRCVLLIIKAKLEAVASGISTIEREFLADIVMSDGRTVGGWLQPQITAMYESGSMPPLLGPKS